MVERPNKIAWAQALDPNAPIFGLDQSQAMEFIGSISNLADGAFEIGTIGMEYDDQTFLLDGNDQRISAQALQEGYNHVIFHLLASAVTIQAYSPVWRSRHLQHQ